MSLRTTQQIEKLIVGQILPRDSNGAYISTGLILVTDNLGRANWTTLSTITQPYIQFTALSTSEGIIRATTNDTNLTFREGAGMNLQIVSNSLFFATHAFTGIDISGGNSLLTSNSSNNIINPRIKFVNGNYTKIRGDPGTNSIFIDVDFLSTTQGARATYTQFIVKNNSSFTEPPESESVVLDAITSSSSLTLIGMDDLRIQVPSLSPNNNVIFIGLSTITAAKFSTAYTRATTDLANLTVLVDTLNARQINTAGVPFGQFNPVSTAIAGFSTMFSQSFISNNYNPLVVTVNANTANINTNTTNITTVSNTTSTNTTNLTTVSNTVNTNTTNINTNAANITTVSNTTNTNTTNLTTVSNTINTNTTNLTTVSNTGVTVSNATFTISNNLTTVSNLTITNSTNIDSAYSTLFAMNSKATGTLSTLTLSTLLVSSLITVSSIDITGNLTVAGQTTLAATFITGGLIADIVTAQFYGDGSHLTGISGGGGGISYLEFYPISTTAIRASTLTTQFYSTLSSIIRNIPINIPANLSTLSLSTGFISARNISATTISTTYGFFSTISAGTIYGKFAGDASLLTNIPNSGAVTYLLSVSNTSSVTTSTSYGFFSTISAGTLYGKHVGDAS